MIVDEVDTDIEMVKDPFLEAGIDIPDELPYQESRKSTVISRFSKKHQSDRLNGADLSSMVPINGEEDFRIWVLGFSVWWRDENKTMVSDLVIKE